jgi:hypothetical protein
VEVPGPDMIRKALAAQAATISQSFLDLTPLEFLFHTILSDKEDEEEREFSKSSFLSFFFSSSFFFLPVSFTSFLRYFG